MDDSPPRRTRRRPPKAPSGSSLPLVPILIGVVVLGFVIGAGLSMANRHGRPDGANVADLTPSPQADVTSSPRATLAPLRTPKPERSLPVPNEPTDVPETPSPRPSGVASAGAPTRPPASPTPRVTLAPLPPSPTPIARASTLAKIVVPAIASATPAPIAPPRATSAPTPPPAPTPTAPPPPTAQPSDDADSNFGRLSASVVRQYLRALARGDTESAYGAFGVSPGSGNVSFSEKADLDPTFQIQQMQARGSNDAQSVNVTFSSASGTYAGQYTLHRTATGAAVIVAHSVTKL